MSDQYGRSNETGCAFLVTALVFIFLLAALYIGLVVMGGLGVAR